MLAHVSLRHYEFWLRFEPVADVLLGETSSMLVALRMLMASSDSCLKCSLAFVLKYPTRGDSKCIARSVMIAMVYLLAHVNIARASVERHLARRKLLLGLGIDGLLLL
jgi:hypothetical protein